MNMSEKNQDQRPVYMGTFSKYTRAFESRVALMENDVEYHKKAIKKQIEKVERLEKTLKANIIITGTALLAMFMLHFLG
jgi:5-bromo-4-chloroindolyl phosphate hydrolysis protein